MRGFMFSIEAMSAVAIIIIALGIFAYSTGTSHNPLHNKEIEAQSESTMGMYFNLPAVASNPSSLEQNCTQIVKYNYTSMSITSKNFCKVIQ